MPALVVGLLIAHQGGWDEILLVVGPIVLVAGLLLLANRRARELQQRTADPSPGDGDPTSETPPR